MRRPEQDWQLREKLARRLADHARRAQADPHGRSSVELTALELWELRGALRDSDALVDAHRELQEYRKFFASLEAELAADGGRDPGAVLARVGLAGRPRQARTMREKRLQLATLFCNLTRSEGPVFSPEREALFQGLGLPDQVRGFGMPDRFVELKVGTDPSRFSPEFARKRAQLAREEGIECPWLNRLPGETVWAPVGDLEAVEQIRRWTGKRTLTAVREALLEARKELKQAAGQRGFHPTFSPPHDSFKIPSESRLAKFRPKRTRPDAHR